MKKTRKFRQATEILTPEDHDILRNTQRLTEFHLPPAFGSVPLELAVPVPNLREPGNTNPTLSNGGEKKPGAPIPIAHALRIKSAEYWLKLGEAELALRELERLPKAADNHCTALKARIAAIGALGERNPMTVQD